TGGTRALHIAGNIQHFFGAILGRDGYKRNRDAEFARRDVSRSELQAGIDAAIGSVERTLNGLGTDALSQPYPEPIAKRTVSTSTFLGHLSVHLAYHLGQLDHHRRAVTGKRWEDGAPFDADGPGTSDLDLTLIGGGMVEHFEVFYIPGLHSAPLSDAHPDASVTFMPLRRALCAIARRPVNIQATADL